MNIIKLPPLSDFGVNSYIVIAENMNGVLIDAPEDGGYISAQLREKGVHLKKILLTHGHCDHIASAARIAEETGAQVYIHSADHKKLADGRTNLTDYFGLPPVEPAGNVHIVEDGDVITQNELEFEVMNTPGHTSGSVCYMIGDNMFCGDTLFKSGMGRTDMPDGDENVMTQTLIMLYEFDAAHDYKLYPGHGECTSMSEERKTNPYMRYAYSHRKITF